MCLAGICDYLYQTDIRKFTAWRHRGPEIQSRRPERRKPPRFFGLTPQTRLQTPKFKCETRKLNVVFINSCSVLSCHLYTEQYLPLLSRMTSPDHFWYICEVINEFET